VNAKVEKRMIEISKDTARMLTSYEFNDGEKNFCLHIGFIDNVCVSWLQGKTFKYVVSHPLTGFVKVSEVSCLE